MGRASTGQARPESNSIKAAPTGTAAYYADHIGKPHWSERHYIMQAEGHVLWETCAHTARGGSARLMRLDNKTLKVTREYLPLDTVMRLIVKE